MNIFKEKTVKPNIKRIDTYSDKRFDQEVLLQHGAFLVDDKHKCTFRIIDKSTAIIEFDSGVNCDELIDEFRFYTEFITNFYDRNMNLIKSFKPIKTFKIDVSDIQPSQFLVDQDKVDAVGTFINNEDDIYIPLAKIGDRYVSRDGHTRLYYATIMKFSSINGFLSDPGDYLDEFAEEARKKQVFSARDLTKVSHEEYEVGWNKFCDDFFEIRENKG